jgi:metal-responsive CopG/Arc/MetJ family transcriptional regulator
MDTTIRNLDEAAYRELKARAAVEGKTIGEAVNDAIRAYLGTPDPRRKRRSLREWTPETYPPGNERLSMEVQKPYEPFDKPHNEGALVELSNETRARLEELAEDRGESGLSELVVEAVEFYLNHRSEEERRIAEALSALGSLNDAEAERLRDSVRRLRATWR